MLKSLSSARRQYAGFLMHMGFVCIAVGVTGSSLGTRQQEFVLAAKGKTAYNAPLSHFAYGGHLTGVCLLGNVAARVGGKLDFDPTALKFTNSEKANELLTRKPRSGWYL